MTIPASVLLPMVSRSSHRTIGLFSTTAGVAIVVAPATTGLCTVRVGLDGFTAVGCGGGASVTLVGIVLGPLLLSAITTFAAASWREGTIAEAAAEVATDPVTMLPKYGFCIETNEL